MQKYSPKFHRTIKLSPAIGDWTTVHQRGLPDPIDIQPIRTSNFDSLTKEELRLLHYLHYRLAEKLCVKFSADMDIKVELHTVLATQMSYKEFLDHAKEKIVQADVTVSPGQKMTIVFDWDLADMMINRLVGGAGSSGQSETFTAIETSILKAQIHAILPDIAQIWHTDFSESSPIDFSVGGYRQNPKNSLREGYVQFGFYLVFGQQDLRKFVIAYPNTLLRSLVQHWQSVRPQQEQKVFFSPKTMQSLKLDLSVSLGGTSLTMAEIRQLQVGDVVLLDTHVDKPLRVHVGTDTECWGYPCVSANRKLAIQIQASDNTESVLPVTDVPLRHKAEPAAFAGNTDRQSAVPPKANDAGGTTSGALVGAAAAATTLAVAAPYLVEDVVPKQVVQEDEFEIEDDLQYEDDHDDPQTEQEEAFDFSESEEDEVEEVHGDTDDSDFSWDDLDDEL